MHEVSSKENRVLPRCDHVYFPVHHPVPDAQQPDELAKVLPCRQSSSGSQLAHQFIEVSGRRSHISGPDTTNTVCFAAPLTSAVMHSAPAMWAALCAKKVFRTGIKAVLSGEIKGSVCPMQRLCYSRADKLVDCAHLLLLLAARQGALSSQLPMAHHSQSCGSNDLQDSDKLFLALPQLSAYHAGDSEQWLTYAKCWLWYSRSWRADCSCSA